MYPRALLISINLPPVVCPSVPQRAFTHGTPNFNIGL
jgi:hypothetical protein